MTKTKTEAQLSDPSETGRKSCHQCKNVKAPYVRCKKQLLTGKICTLLYCEGCLWKRYKEKMSMLDTWSCPRYRGICTCTQCERKIGCKPVGHAVGKRQATESLPPASASASTAEDEKASDAQQIEPLPAVDPIDVGPSERMKKV